MERLRNTWNLAKVSWGVLKKDRELLVLPVLSFLISAVVLLIAALVLLAVTSVTDGEFGASSLVIVVAASLAVGAFTVFFNGALVAGAHERLTGGDPAVGSSIGRAFSRISGLLPWAILTTTVGIVLSMLRDRAGWLGDIAVRLIGAAWDVVTFLTVPAIIIDRLGAVDALKRSASLLRQTWGENLAAQAGFGIVGFLLLIPAAVVAALALVSGVTFLAVLGVVIAAAWVAAVMVVMAALGAIFQTALYLYATTGVSPAGFERARLNESFAPKKAKTNL